MKTPPKAMLLTLTSFIITLAVLIALPATSQDKKSPEDEYNTKGRNHVALKGYDPVTYFTENEPIKGDKLIKIVHEGIEYHFASNENADKFRQDPEKYLPAYGGWCATAMAEGDKVDIDPEHYEIENGRLFLFYKGFFGDAKKDWDKNQTEMEKNADAAWKQISGEDKPKKKDKKREGS